MQRLKSGSSGEAIGFGARPSLPLTYPLVIAEQSADTPLKQFPYVAGTTAVPGDVNGDGDGRIGMPEVIFILQTVAGMR